jgi:hypothetical protein
MVLSKPAMRLKLFLKYSNKVATDRRNRTIIQHETEWKETNMQKVGNLLLGTVSSQKLNSNAALNTL